MKNLTKAIFVLILRDVRKEACKKNFRPERTEKSFFLCFALQKQALFIYPIINNSRGHFTIKAFPHTIHG